MYKNNFFKPTPLYKEYLILDLIEKNKNITQRFLSLSLGVAVSMINNYLNKYESMGLIKRKRYSLKTIKYIITKKGNERKKILNIGYLDSSKYLYFQAKENLDKFLEEILNKGFKDILLYGAGEVAEMIIHTVMTRKEGDIRIISVIDDDSKKIGTKIGNYNIVSNKEIKLIDHDGILISTYNRKNEIKMKINALKYPEDKILEFFE